MKHGKKYVDSFKAIDKAKQYDAPEALELAAKGAKAKFDETIELHIRLGVDSRHADQQVRGAVVLPNGTGKTVRVCVFCKEDKYEAAKAADDPRLQCKAHAQKCARPRICLISWLCQDKKYHVPTLTQPTL